MNNFSLNKNYLIYFFLGIFSFYLNFYVGSLGVFPFDTFFHYDNGYRILLGEHPVKDYWIVHGFLIDYIQAFFFKFFGNEWKSYLYHSSIFNSCIVLFSYYIFRLLNIEIKKSLAFSISIAVLAYPVSGTPFVDLHSTYFSLFATYFGIVAIKKEKSSIWFWTSLFLCLAFFSKQVPAGYTIVVMSIFVLFLTFKEKNIYIILYYAAGALFFLSLLFIFLILNKISIYDFILQIFLFPSSIGSNRYETYSLEFKNIFIDYKFIYIIFFTLIILNIRKYFNNKKFDIKNLNIFLLLSIIVVTSIFHQIYTKNQIYIFFLIPICSGFVIYFNDLKKKNLKNFVDYFVILICVFTTFKYNERFNIERKFHELQNTNISNSVDASKIDKKLKGLNWITPYFEKPEEEIFYINYLLNILNNEKNVMVVTQYNFFSTLTEKKLFSPSRTYDSISYPRKNTKYFNNYKIHLENLLEKNNVEKIFIFEPFLKINLNEIIFNYIPEKCFTKKNLNEHLIQLSLKKCNNLL